MKRLIFMLMISLLLISCNGNDASLIGKWNPENVDFEDVVMEFTDEYMIILGSPVPYTLDDNKIIITTAAGEEVIEFKVTEKKLTLMANGKKQVYIRILEEE